MHNLLGLCFLLQLDFILGDNNLVLLQPSCLRLRELLCDQRELAFYVRWVRAKLPNLRAFGYKLHAMRDWLLFAQLKLLRNLPQRLLQHVIYLRCLLLDLLNLQWRAAIKLPHLRHDSAVLPLQLQLFELLPSGDLVG